MLCKIFLGYSFGIKPYVGAKFCVVLLSQRNSLAVRDLGPSRSQRVFPRRKAFTAEFLKSFPVRPYFRFVKAKPVFTLVEKSGTYGRIIGDDWNNTEQDVTPWSKYERLRPSK